MIVNLIIPAKGQADGIYNKNLYKIEGKTLVYIACETALLCKNVNNVYIDTESQEVIYEIKPLLSKGLKIINRPKALASSDIGPDEMIMYGLHSVSDCDVLLQMFSTTPMITAETIHGCIEKFANSYPTYDSFISVTPRKDFLWRNPEPSVPVNFDSNSYPRTKDLDCLYAESQSLYGIHVEKLLDRKKRVGQNPMLIEIPKLESFCVKSVEDFEIVESLYKSKRS